jgi:hypothetical protein
MKLTGALGETTSKAAGVLAAGVTTAMGRTQQGVSMCLYQRPCTASVLHHTCLLSRPACSWMRLTSARGLTGLGAQAPMPLM